jgi:hypothetical protein
MLPLLLWRRASTPPRCVSWLVCPPRRPVRHGGSWTARWSGASYLTPDNTELVAYGTTAYQNNLLGLSRDIGSSATTN